MFVYPLLIVIGGEKTDHTTWYYSAEVDHSSTQVINLHMCVLGDEGRLATVLDSW